MMSRNSGSPPQFYVYEDRNENTDVDHKPPLQRFSSGSSLIPSQLDINSLSIPHIKDLDEILIFPIESSHSYSYAQFSPNSLALRLNVLKRSLEILNDHPGLIHGLAPPRPIEDDSSFPPIAPVSSNSSLNGPVPSSKKSFFKFSNNSNDHLEHNNKSFKRQNNGSSAALAAFFRPQIKRSDSHPLEKIMSNDSEHCNKKISNSNNDVSLKEIITFLDSDSESILKNSELAHTLDDLSLNSNKQSTNKQDILKHKLYYALATPFVETTGFVIDTNLPKTPTSTGSQSPTIHQSSIALNLLNTQSPVSPNPLTQNQGNINRPFHSLAAKRGLPQSVFTVSFENPWEVKAANDLACLMFGVSRSNIKHLTLMDLIAPQFRDFVANRLVTGNLSQLVKNNLLSTNSDLNNIYFAGEIVAISCPGHHNYTYTSLWAKKKGDLIICMFDQIPCDAFNVLISKKKEDDDKSKVQHEYSIDFVTEIGGNFFDGIGTDKFQRLGQLSKTLSTELINLKSGSDANENPDPSQFEIQEPDSEYINKIRYYTLQLKDEFVPCAITSNPLDSREGVHEIKLNIHTLPYIAGMFVIDSHDYSILSCNNAIAKNLFGKSLHELLNKSIDTVIPKFSKILNYGIDSNVDLNFIQGLVLPEHFFRKYDAVLKSHERGTNDEEDLFFKSKGIEGIHRDGNPLLIDVQLRDSGSGTFVVWITYSRATNKGMSNDLQKLASTGQDNSTSPIAEQPEIEAEKKSYVTNFKHKISPIPDLSVVTENHLKHRRVNTINHAAQSSEAQLVPDDLDFAPSSAEISRKSSTRKPKAGTFGIPVNKLNKALGDSMSWDTQRKVSIDETRKIRSISNNSIITSADSSETLDTDDTSVKSDLEKTKPCPYSTYSEEEILKLEDEVLASIIERSDEWPREVGLKRRTKKFSEFKILKDMGEGAYGKVVLAVHEKDPVYKIIIKCIDKKRILVDTWVRDRKLGTIPSEIQIMANLNSEPHPNIMRIVDFFEDSNYYYLETPIFGNPPAIDLFDYIEVKTDMSESECQFIFKQICSAIYHLHKHGIVHRDIKDENVIVDENGLIKLIDFGSAGYTKQGPFDVFVGTIDYASPEVLRGEKYEGKPQDIWALGILLYTMLYKENPFYNVDEIMEGDLRIPRIISDGSIDLIQKILVRDLKNRPTITDIVEHSWLQ